MGLEKYRSKRDFSRTPEPEGALLPAAGLAPVFVIQMHAARQLHYDFRLEIDGVLKSWAIPRGPSLDPADKRLAVEVEDHPLAYAGFEGIIPAGEYGGGTVLLWDRGHWFPLGDAAAGYRNGRLRFRLEGEKLHGEWTLVRMAQPSAGPEERSHWLLVKHQDEFARPDAELDITELRSESVHSGRGMDDIAAGRAPVQVRERAPAPLPDGPPPAVMPDFITPQLATLVEDSPREGLWLAETKFDGYRLLAQVDDGVARLWTRNRQDWSGRLPGVVAELQRLPVRNAWLDGELVALDRRGRASFNLLQQALSRRGAGVSGLRLRYYVFDMPFLDGQDLRELPQLERKDRLRELLAATVPEALAGSALGSGEHSLRYCSHGVGRLDDAFREACLQGEEGVVLKRADAPYRAGRSPHWLKLKCGHRQEFVVGGYTLPEGRREGFGALLLGFYTSEGTLAYAGRVGSGFDRAMLATLGARLQGLQRAGSPFDSRLGVAEQADAQWVRPELVVDVRFAGWTRQERLRQARFLGLREDKPARDVLREQPQLPLQLSPGPEAAPEPDAKVAGVRLSHPSRLVYPGDGISKLEVARYYERVAERLLPYLQERPLVLLRCPAGIGSGFLQKHPVPGMPDAVQGAVLPEGAGGGRYFAASTPEALMELVQLGMVELHAMQVRQDRPGCPDRLVLDLDPGPDLSWPVVVERVQLVRELLQELALPAFLKGTGGRGVHVEVPLRRVHAQAEVAAFAGDLARLLAGQMPTLFTASAARAERAGRVYIDWQRNVTGASAVAALSLRARPGAPVALPLAWEELPDALPGRFTLHNVPVLLAARPDPWQSYAHVRARLAPDLLARIGRGE